MKKSTNVNGRREVALKNIEKHLADHKKAHPGEGENDEWLKAAEARHKREMAVLRDRIKGNAKYRKLLKRAPSPKVAMPAEPTPA